MSGASGQRENRRRARVQAVQHLYGREMQGVLVAGEHAAVPGDEEPTPFALELIDHASGQLAEIDRLLASALQNWDINRLGAVDRAVLRVAVGELISQHDIPAAVTINEAIEIARHLGAAESARFVNGVLDRVRKEIGRDARTTN